MSPPRYYTPRPRVPPANPRAGVSPSRRGRGVSHNPGRGAVSGGRSGSPPLSDRVSGARISKPAPRGRGGRGGHSPGPSFRRPASPAAPAAAGGGGGDLAAYIRDARATFAAGNGPIFITSAGERPAGFLSPAWRAPFEGDDGWTYTTSFMFMFAKWAEAAADGRVSGMPGTAQLGETKDRKWHAEKLKIHPGEDFLSGVDGSRDAERRERFTKLWKRIIQSTNGREQSAMCMEAGIDWSKCQLEARMWMRQAIEMKFDNPNVPGSKLLREGLLATKDREIVYLNFDKFFGIGLLEGDVEIQREQWGENILGKMLMKYRDDRLDGKVVSIPKDTFRTFGIPPLPLEEEITVAPGPDDNEIAAPREAKLSDEDRARELRAINLDFFGIDAPPAMDDEDPPPVIDDDDAPPAKEEDDSSEDLIDFSDEE